jgi:hypothetical protein
MAEDREHVLHTHGGVSVHDDERCWCSDTRSPETDWYLEVIARAERSRIAQGTAKPTERRPIDGDRE